MSTSLRVIATTDQCDADFRHLVRTNPAVVERLLVKLAEAEEHSTRADLSPAETSAVQMIAISALARLMAEEHPALVNGTAPVEVKDPSAIVLARLELVERRLDAENDWTVMLYATGNKVECEVQCDGGLALLCIHLSASVVKGDVVLKVDRVVGLTDEGAVEWEHVADKLLPVVRTRLEQFALDYLDLDTATELGQIDQVEQERRREAGERGIR